MAKRPTICKHTNIWEWIASVGNHRDCRVLEIGSRSVVSDMLWKRFIPLCNYTGLDVHEGRNVTITGDAHCLTDLFAPKSFDLIISLAVFEHIAMPWIVAEEIAKVLDVQGHVGIETHFSFSEHELPWHFYQFNSNALENLFCPELGFRVIDSGMDNPIDGRFADTSAEYLRGQYVGNLYCHSSIVAQKINNVAIEKPFDWRRVAQRIYHESMYPAPR